MGFSRREYWNELPFPSPGDLPDPGIEPASLSSCVLAGRLFTSSATEKPAGDTRGFFLAPHCEDRGDPNVGAAGAEAPGLVRTQPLTSVKTSLEVLPSIRSSKALLRIN